MRNKKKLVKIIIIVSIVCFSLVTVLFVIYRNTYISTEDEITNEEFSKDDILEDVEETTEIIDEENILENNNIVSSIEDKPVIDIKKNTNVKEKSNNSNQSNSKQITSKETISNQPQVIQETKEIQVNPIISQQPTQKNEEVQTKITTQTKEESEKYVRNDTMINKIRKVIESNESENMKNYGYNIQVDSSIKSLTNQFTFAESRVISCIKYSFGTIRIYAEDYYKNGQLIMTECYIY